MTEHITNCKNCGGNEFVNGICLYCGTNYGKPISVSNYPLSSGEKIVIQITNPTNKTLNARLFVQTPNFVQDDKLIIKTLEGKSYSELLKSIRENQLIINRWRFVSSNVKQLKQCFVLHINDKLISPERWHTEPISLAQHQDAFQNCITSVNVNYPVNINSDMFSSIDILPNTILSIIGFPAYVLKR